MTERTARVGTLAQGQTVESLLNTGVVSSKLLRFRQVSSDIRLAPCKCGEGIVRLKGILKVCPECDGSRVIVVTNQKGK